MPAQDPIETKNLSNYDNEPLPWSRAVVALSADPSEHVTWFLGVVEADGAPHAAGVGAVWSDGEIFFVSGPKTRKSKALAKHPAMTLSVRLEGIDLVFEGGGTRVTDAPTLERLAKFYREQGGWPAEVQGEGFTAPFNAPSAGPPPWYLYRLNFRDVYGVATAEPHGATRWRFGR